MIGLIGLAEASPGRDLAVLEAAARGGDGVALFTLAEMHETADGIEQDLSLAAALYRLAAERGHGGAQYRLGLAHAVGLGVPTDPLESYLWLSLAARTDDPAGVLAGALRAAIGAQLEAPQRASADQRVRAFRPVTGSVLLPVSAAGGTVRERIEAWLAEDRCGPLLDRWDAAGRRQLRAYALDGADAKTPARAPSFDADLDLKMVLLTAGPCNALRLLDKAGIVDQNSGLVLRDQDHEPKDVFEEGDWLIIEIGPYDRAGQVAIDYFSHDGQVLHMLPLADQVEYRVTVGQKLTLGEAGSRQRWQLTPPFGDDLLVVWWSERPLHGAARPAAETIDLYLSSLRSRLAESGPNEAVRAAFRVVRTRPR